MQRHFPHIPRQRKRGGIELDRPFVAIDFETADKLPDSACSVALVRVEAGQILERFKTEIRPPRREMLFTHIHGLRWEDVEKAPTFAEAWPEMEAFVEGAEFFAAHNASFDKKVLLACCEAAGLPAPNLEFLCTVALARKTWRLFPTRLPDVCRHLDIPLDHHQALSDAEACAKIVIAANQAA